MILWTVTPSLVEAFHAAFYSCGRWAPSIPTWVTTQSHDLLSMFVDFGLSATNTQSRVLLSMFVDFGLSVPTSGIPRLLTTPGLNLMSYHAAQTSSARIQDVDGIRRLHISRLRPLESNPVRLTLSVRTSRLDQTYIKLDVSLV